MDAPAEPVERIYAVIRAIPRGRVATYGQVACLAGLDGRARLVARALRLLPPGSGLPWYRVVGRRAARMAHITIPDPTGAARQRETLAAEGVCFTASDGIRLREHGWLPVD